MQNSAAYPVDAHAQNTKVNRISITTILAVFRNLNGKDGSELDRRKSMRRKPRRPKMIARLDNIYIRKCAVVCIC
jgi:hypothetical protein